LLHDFFEHEVLVAAFDGGDGVDADGEFGDVDGGAIEGHDFAAFGIDDGELTRFEGGDGVGVVDEGGEVAGDEHFAVAMADGDAAGVADAEGDNLFGVGGAEARDGVCATELEGG
jgi:hypothetical protein